MQPTWRVPVLMMIAITPSLQAPNRSFLMLTSSDKLHHTPRQGYLNHWRRGSLWDLRRNWNKREDQNQQHCPYEAQSRWIARLLVPFDGMLALQTNHGEGGKNRRCQPTWPNHRQQGNKAMVTQLTMSAVR